MRKKADAFAFSLDGLRAAASFAVVPAITSDRINRAWDERLSQHGNDRSNDFDPEGWPEPA